MKISKLFKTAILSFSAFAFISCGGGGGSTGDSGSNNQSYKITITNLTAGQNFSDFAIIVKSSSSSYSSFKIGSTASEALEYLAEGGDNSKLISEAKNKGVLYTGFLSGINTSENKKLTFSVPKNQGAKLELLSMLTKTNDAFVGLEAYDINAISGSQTLYLNAYDSGTEKNDELSANIPGLKGTGFDSTRNDDANMITLHPGVLSNLELNTSNLTQKEKFNNPVAKILIEKL